MVTDSEIFLLAVPERFFGHAYAYQSAAYALCAKMTSEDTSCTWPNAAVALWLSMLFMPNITLFQYGGRFWI